MSNIEDSWPESWPNKDSDWDGYWNGQYGKYTRADQESYFVMDDYYNDEYNYFEWLFLENGWDLFPNELQEILQKKRKFYFSFRFFQYKVNHRSLFHLESKKHHFH